MEYSYIDINKEFEKGNLIEKIYAFYWENINNKWIRKQNVYENKDYYFYIDIKERGKALEIRDVKIYPDIFTTVNGEKCIKIEPTKKLNAKQFKELRERFTKTYESDIPALTRWISKNKPKYSKDVRLLYIDIETLKYQGSYSKPSDAEGTIILISCYDNFTEEYITFSFKKFNKKDKDVIAKNEEDMLDKFLLYLRKINPDYILGWNIESYDIPYLLNRMKKLGINYNAFSRLNNVTYKQSEEISSHKFSSFYINIRGMGVFDLMSASQRLWLGKYCGYSLDKMSKQYLNKTKIEVDNIDELYETDIDKLVEYNIKDVSLCVELNTNLQLFKKFQSLQDIISINVHSALIQSNNIVQYMLQKTDRVLLNSNYKDGKEEYEGGFVLDSIPGIYDNCYKYDFVSMYPSIIITYNISPDTILNKKEEGCINMNDKYFFKQEEGIITKIMKELYIRRINYKKMKNEDMSLAYKLLMNSIYGQFVAPYSRIYSFICGTAITYQGRRMIKSLQKNINSKLKGKIILGDTDSLIYHQKEEFNSDIIINMFEEIINDIYDKDNIQNNKLIKLELEKIVDKIIIFGNENKTIKKKYVELYKGKVRLVGTDSIKSDTVELAKDMQNKLIEYILKNKPKKKEINLIIQEYKEKFYKMLKECNYKYIAIPAKINKPLDSYKKNTFSTKAIINSNHKIGMNERFYILATKEGPYAFKSNSDIINKKLEIDKEYMWDRIVKKADIFFDFLSPEQKTLKI